MKKGIINLDDKFAKKIGFTSDKFEGYLWKQHNVIWISLITSIHEGKGNLRQLFDSIENNGYRILVPNPSNRMKAICNKRRMTLAMINNDGDATECMVKL